MMVWKNREKEKIKRENEEKGIVLPIILRQKYPFNIFLAAFIGYKGVGFQAKLRHLFSKKGAKKA